MPLADKLHEKPKRTNGLPCSVGSLLETLPESEAKALHDMLYTLGWSAKQIHKAVTDEGHTIAFQTINRHRSSSCRCFL